MNTLKYNNARRNSKATNQGFAQIMATLPASLVHTMTGRQIALMIDHCEATYLDGYRAAGGDTCDTINHRDDHRKAAAK